MPATIRHDNEAFLPDTTKTLGFFHCGILSAEAVWKVEVLTRSKLLSLNRLPFTSIMLRPDLTPGRVQQHTGAADFLVLRNARAGAVNSESLALVQSAAGRSSAADLRRSGQLEAKVTELFKMLHRPVLRYVLAILGDRGTAEDVTQDVS